MPFEKLLSVRPGQTTAIFVESIQMTAMCTFIDDYLKDPSKAILTARQNAERRFCDIDCPEETIYSQLSSPEFRLYEEVLFS